MQNELGFFYLAARVLQGFWNIKNPQRLLSSLQLPWFVLTSRDTRPCRQLPAMPRARGSDWGQWEQSRVVSGRGTGVWAPRWGCGGWSVL